MKLRILLISYFGLADYTIALANALAKNNNVMLVLAKKSALSFIDQIEESVISYLIDFPRLRNPRNLFYTLKIYRQIKNFDPDIIHFQGGFIWFAFILPLLRRWPIVTTIHDAEPHQGDILSRNMRWFLPNVMALRFSSKLIVHGDNIKNELLTKSAIHPDKIIKIIHGDSFLYRHDTTPKKCEHHRILFFGRILKYKGLPYLLKAQPLISQEIPDLKICIAGEGDILKNYDHLFIDRDCYEIYNHYIDNKLMVELFQKSCLIVLPYSEASQSGVVSLAYTFSRPVVATNVGALPEIVEHNKTGLIVPPNDEKKLAEAIISLLKDENKCTRLGQNAYRKVKTEMSWENVAHLTEAVYADVLKIF